MPTENDSRCPNCSGKTEGLHRRGAIMVAHLSATAVVVALLPWVAHQMDCFRREQHAKATLEAAIYPGAIGPTSLALVSGPTAEEAPYLTVSELRRGRLYVPIVYVSLGGGGWPTTTQRVDQEAWDQLRSFRYLERLQVSGCSIAPDVVADFSGFTHLRSLAITETPFLSRDIRTLSQLLQLQTVIIEKKQGIDEWLPSVAQLRHLRSLTIEGDVSDQGVRALAGLETLESLALEGERITSGVVSALARLKNLTTLTLLHTRIDDEGLRQLTALKGLKELHLRGGNRISDHGVRFLAALEALEVLDLSSNRITTKSAPTLVRLKNLKYLMLPNTQFGDEGLRQLSGLKGLEVLILDGSAIANVGAELRFPQLGFLSLRDTNLTDVGVRNISRLPRLRLLNIAGTGVTNASIDTLTAIPSLMEVYAYDTQIDEHSAKWLRLMSTLQTKRANDGDDVLQGSIDVPPE